MFDKKNKDKVPIDFDPSLPPDEKKKPKINTRNLVTTVIISVVVAVVVYFGLGFFGVGGFVSKIEFDKKMDSISKEMSTIKTNESDWQTKIQKTLNGIPDTINSLISNANKNITDKVDTAYNNAASAKSNAESANATANRASESVNNFGARLSETYTKSEVDAKISSAITAQPNVYTKAEVDAMVKALQAAIASKSTSTSTTSSSTSTNVVNTVGDLIIDTEKYDTFITATLSMDSDYGESLNYDVEGVDDLGDEAITETTKLNLELKSTAVSTQVEIFYSFVLYLESDDNNFEWSNITVKSGRIKCSKSVHSDGDYCVFSLTGQGVELDIGETENVTIYITYANDIEDDIEFELFPDDLKIDEVQRTLVE